MFSNLIESAPRPERRTLQSLLSIGLHAALGVGAVEASRRVMVDPLDGPRIDTTIYVVAEPRITRPAVPRFENSPGPVVDAPVQLPVPTLAPVGLPPIERGPAIDPRRFVLRATGSVCDGCPRGEDTNPVPAVFTELTVDRPVEAIDQPAPGYPPLLRTAGLNGRVVLQFVVDTAGRVEPETITALEASHPAFMTSARQSIERSRFRPATFRGTRVRQLVTQVIRFRIE